MNLYMHDIEDFRVLRGDTLREPKFHDSAGGLSKYDVVIANPPFSLKNWGAEAWLHDPWQRSFCGTPPASNGDFAWVQHMIRSMRQRTGRVGRRYAPRRVVQGRAGGGYSAVLGAW